MKLIVGLGNPGDKYKYTRHNVGFMVVEKFIKDKLSLLPSLKAWKKDEKIGAEICSMKDIIVIKPQIFMNFSGLAVTRIADFYKINADDIWVVHDDIDLPLGKIRIRKGGASAGHHGVDSIIRQLGKSEFVRFRLGIGKGKLEVPKSADVNLHRKEVEKYVVAPFHQGEGGEMKKLIKHAAEAIEIALEKGIDKAMNRFN